MPRDHVENPAICAKHELIIPSNIIENRMSPGRRPETHKQADRCENIKISVVEQKRMYQYVLDHIYVLETELEANKRNVSGVGE